MDLNLKLLHWYHLSVVVGKLSKITFCYQANAECLNDEQEPLNHAGRILHICMPFISWYMRYLYGMEVFEMMKLISTKNV